MSTSKCKIEDMAEAVMTNLYQYSDDVTKQVKTSVDVVAKEVNEEIKAHVTFKGTGKYVKAFRLKKTFENSQEKRVTWYVNVPHYRLTHLLENGHAIKQGGRARAFPHIKYGEELAQRRMEELAREAVENA